MARIVDKDTRLIDIDFGVVFTSLSRPVGEFVPSVAFSGNGVDQILNTVSSGQNPGGSFIQYQMIDLSYMTMNNEVMQPLEVSVQRTSPVPLGYHLNGNNFEQMEEYLFVFSRPLNNSQIADGFLNVESFRNVGLDRSTGAYGGTDTGVPSHQQTIYAEKRMYSYSNQLMASITNGELVSDPPQMDYNTMTGMPVLDSVITWGTLSAITGPQLHCYRLVIMRNQNFEPQIPGLFVNTEFLGATVCSWPPVNITLLCKDPDYTEGEYLTRLSNAMNNIPEGGETA